MIATVSAARSSGKEDQLVMDGRTANAQLRVAYLRHGKGDGLLFSELLSISLDLVHALT